MPNWCNTNITIQCDDEKKLKELEEKINMWSSKDYMDNGFGHNWLGNVVLGSGVGTVDTGENTDIRCRGTIMDIELIGCELIIDTETAWGPMVEMWVKVLDKYLPEAALYYTAEECGCEVYMTNDPEYKGKYVVDAYELDELDSDWECKEEWLIADLQKLLKTDETSVDKLLSMFYDSEYSENASIHQWEYCPAEELD